MPDTPDRCPRCYSPAPDLHPAVQYEGEVQPCSHEFHKRVTPQNTPAKIAGVASLLHALDGVREEVMRR